MTDNGERPGRVSGEVAGKLRKEILSGHRPGGSYLPGIRELASIYGVAKVTAGRAVKALEGEGLVVAQPRKGYRVLSGAGDPGNGLPIAYVYSGQYAAGIGSDEAASRRLLEEFQQVAGSNNWSLLVLKSQGRQPDEIMKHLTAARVCGVIADAIDRPLFERMRKMGMPTVAVDNYLDHAPVDTVVQDGFMGGLLAAGYLTGRGHKRFGWLGPDPAGSCAQITERLGGAAAGILQAGLPVDSLSRLAVPLGNLDEAARRTETMLADPNRPFAFFALWQDATEALLEAARRRGLSLGKDFEMVGWCTREELASGRLNGMPGGSAAPLIVWSMSEMADVAVGRLMYRRKEPTQPIACLRVAVALDSERVEVKRGMREET